MIAVSPTRHFSYSSGSRSSMYRLILSFARCLRMKRSLFTVPFDTCSICAISLWLYPWLLSSCTLLHANQFYLFPFPYHYCYCYVQLPCSNVQYHRACFEVVVNFHAWEITPVLFNNNSYSWKLALTVTK